MPLTLLQCPDKIIPDSRKFTVDLSPVAAVASLGWNPYLQA